MPLNNSTCHVCLHNLTLRRLKTHVTDVQANLRAEWQSSPVVQLDEHLFPSEGNKLVRELDWFLLNELGKATVIPSYSVSNRTWKKASFINPVEVDWMRFEVHDTVDMNYLIEALEVLEDMRGLWANDMDTCMTPVMLLFGKFIGGLKRLLMFATNVSISA
jgi:hypothetical protein